MSRNLWKATLIAALIVAIIRPARAESLDTAGKQIYAGIAVVGAAVAVGIVLIVLHEKHKTRAITGCVASGTSGMSVTDDKDKRVYVLSGDPVGIKPGERMTLQGKPRGGKVPVFDAQSVVKDLGVCQP
jgi:hypothetical protein